MVAVKYRVSGVHDPEALESKMTVRPIDFAKSSPLKRLDYLLGFLKKNEKELLESYIVTLQKRYDDLTISNVEIEN